MAGNPPISQPKSDRMTRHQTLQLGMRRVRSDQHQARVIDPADKDSLKPPPMVKPRQCHAASDGFLRMVLPPPMHRTPPELPLVPVYLSRLGVVPVEGAGTTLVGVGYHDYFSLERAEGLDL